MARTTAHLRQTSESVKKLRQPFGGRANDSEFYFHYNSSDCAKNKIKNLCKHCTLCNYPRISILNPTGMDSFCIANKVYSKPGGSNHVVEMANSRYKMATSELDDWQVCQKNFTTADYREKFHPRAY
jgi:hypothetical protein